MKKVYLHLLVWNDRKYLPDLFASLEKQTYKNVSLRILDNGSTDDTFAYIQEYFPKTIVAKNVKNQGFAGGHNQLMKFTFEHRIDEDEDPYVMIVNSDMILDENCIEGMATFLDEHPDVQGVQPKLLRAFEDIEDGEDLKKTIQSDILDSTGLRVSRGWRMSDRGAGELDKGQYDQKTDIFAPSGTMAMYRLSAIKTLLEENGEFFDGTFFAYREDCDMAWRFQKAGFNASFVPTAIAWHYRGMYGAEKQSWFDRLKNRKGQRPFFAALSTRNQLLVLVKNLSFVDAVLALPWLILGEGLRVTYGFFFEKETRKRLWQIPFLLKEMLGKRSVIKKKQERTNKDIRAYARTH